MADVPYGPRSKANARALLDAAAELGLHPGVVRTQAGGYLVPEEVVAIVVGVQHIEENHEYEPPPAPEVTPEAAVETPKRPAVNEPKDVWVNYATAINLTVAEDATKAEVIDLVKSAEAEEGTD